MSFFSTNETIREGKTPYIYSYNTQDNILTYPNSHKVKRTMFVKKMNNWLEQYNLPANFDFENTVNFEKSLNDNDIKLIKNKDIINDVIKTLIKLVQKKYKIHDEYQFKEDLCYFLYSMSSEV